MIKNRVLRPHLRLHHLRHLRRRLLNKLKKVEKYVKANDYYMIIFKCHFLKV